MKSYVDLKTKKRECNANAHTCVNICKKIPSRTLVILRTWIKKISGILLFFGQTTRRMGQSRWIDDDQIRRQRTPQFFRATCPLSRGTLKSKRCGKIINTLLCRWRYDWNCFFRTIISVITQLSTYGAVSDLCDEYSACQARTVRHVLAGQSDPLFEPARLLMTAPTLSIEIPAQEDLLQKYKERVEWKSFHNQIDW